jgi:hypothetical protein
MNFERKIFCASSRSTEGVPSFEMRMASPHNAEIALKYPSVLNALQLSSERAFWIISGIVSNGK